MTDEIQILFEKLANKILDCRTRTGRRFVCKLVAVENDLLFFETKDGRIIINDIADIYSAAEYVKKSIAVNSDWGLAP